MIGRLAQTTDQLGVDAGVERGVGDDFLEQRRLQQAGAGEREQQPAGVEQLKA